MGDSVNVRMPAHHAMAIGRIAKAKGQEPHEAFADMVNDEHVKTFGVPVSGHEAPPSAGDDGKNDVERQHDALRENSRAAIGAMSDKSEGDPDNAAARAAYERLDAVGDADDGSASSSDDDEKPKPGGAPNPLLSWSRGSKSKRK